STFFSGATPLGRSGGGGPSRSGLSWADGSTLFCADSSGFSCADAEAARSAQSARERIDRNRFAANLLNRPLVDKCSIIGLIMLTGKWRSDFRLRQPDSRQRHVLQFVSHRKNVDGSRGFIYESIAFHTGRQLKLIYDFQLAVGLLIVMKAGIFHTI